MLYKFITFIGEAKIGEIILLSFFIFPIILISWLKIFVELEIDFHHDKIIVAGVLLFLYILAIALTKTYYCKVAKIKQAKEIIKIYLHSKGWEKISFNRIRININETYDDTFLEKITVNFNKEFSPTKIKNVGSGLKLAEPDNEEDEE